MEANNGGRAPADFRPPFPGSNGLESVAPNPLPPRPPLARADSRSALPAQAIRPGVPPQQQQQRPQFQPGAPVSIPPQLAPRPGTPVARGPAPGPPGQQQNRPPPLRLTGPQSFSPQQGPRPVPQSPSSGQPPLRVPPPNNLQFGPRQSTQFGGTTTPDGARPQIVNHPNSGPRPSVPSPVTAQLPRQLSQGTVRGLENSNSFQNKSVNLENESYTNGGHPAIKPENGGEIPGVPKSRSYSIAAAPGAPSPLKMEDDRRKSVSAIGGKVEEFMSRAPGLGLIQEGKIESKDNVRSSKESIRSEASNEGMPERPESRLSGSKMTESFIGSLPSSTPQKKFDDNDDVVSLNNTTSLRNIHDPTVNQNKVDLDRSPSLTRSDGSPELKQNLQQSSAPNKFQSVTPELVRARPEQEIRSEPKPAPIQNKPPPKSPVPDVRPPSGLNKKPNDLNTVPSNVKNSTPRKSASATKYRQKDGDNDSGVDESTQGNDVNCSPGSPNKKIPSKLPTKEKSSSSLKQSLSRSSSKSAAAKTPENPVPVEKKKVPMNKIQVGNAPSPNIKAVKSKIGSLDNATYKPGGGKVKIENRKLEFGNITPRIAAKNDAYAPSGGSKKITTTKLEWNAKSKIGSLQNAAYKPGGGDKKIETVKLDFKDKAKPKIASTANITHKPGGGVVKIENQKLEFKAQSKVGSLDNVKHKAGGGDVKIFDDKEYIKQMSGQSPLPGSHVQSRQEEYHYMEIEEWTDDRPERPLSRCRSARAPRTPRTPRALSPRRKSIAPLEDEERVLRNNEKNRRLQRPATAREPSRSACSRRGSTLSQRPAFTVY